MMEYAALYYSRKVDIDEQSGKVLLVFIDTQPIVYDFEERQPKKQ